MRAVQLLLALPIVAAAAALALAEWFWLGDLALFFLPWIALAAFAALAFFWIIGASVLASAAAFFLLTAGAVISDAHPPQPEWSSEGAPLRITSFNAFIGNADPTQLETYLRAELPDIVVLQETFGRFELDIIGRVDDLYPHRARVVNGEVAVLSRLPILSAETLASDGGRGTAGSLLRAEFDIGETRLVLFAIHAPTPRLGSDIWQRRNDLLADLAGVIAEVPENAAIIVAGDLNTPPWSPYFAELLEAADLVDTSGRLIPLATRIVDRREVPAGFGAPVDHVLVSPGIAWRTSRTGPPIGSDHLPITVDLRLP